MAIRCAAKALIVKNGCLLLNRCRRGNGDVYYDLPGGGQHPFESMEEAVRREVLEEAGIGVRIIRFAALAEEIYTSEVLRQKYPDYAHRMMHIFLAEPDDTVSIQPTQKDLGMEESVWIPLDEVENLPEVRPTVIQKRICEIVCSDAPVYLGTEYVNWEQE